MLRLSYSGYKRYLQCPAYYAACLTQPRIPPTIDMFLGTVIQAVFEKMVNDGYPDCEHVIDSIPNVIDKCNEKEKLAISDWFIEQAKQAVSVSYSHIAGFKDFNYASEKALIAVFNGIELYGRLDFVSIEHALIVDGKATDQKDKYVDFDQLVFYAYLFYLTYGKIPHTAFLYYFFGETQLVYQSEKKLNVFKSKLMPVVEGIKNEQFQLRTKGWHCSSCPIQRSCNTGLFNERRPLEIGNDQSIDYVNL